MKLTAPDKYSNAVVEVPTSKSIANRLLIIQALAGSGLISDLSEAKDTQILKELTRSLPPVLDVGHAGTTFRFLTSFLALQQGTFVLTGSTRMRERPISVLVDALKELGANITYIDKKGFPPLKIIGAELLGREINVKANISSQFITALMLIGPYLESGLTIKLEGKMVSFPYISMTASLMESCGLPISIHGNQIMVPEGKYNFRSIKVEKDWSAIAFWYEYVAVGKIPHILIKEVSKHSIQGDSKVREVFEKLGVESSFDHLGLHLSFNEGKVATKRLNFDLIQTPDLAQPLVVACVAQGHQAIITGLSTLKNKETDRGKALKVELAKLGIDIKVGEDFIELPGGDVKVKPTIRINTYEDHRMAMAFAPLVLMTKILEIDHPDVVEKSYPHFWKQLSGTGIWHKY